MFLALQEKKRGREDCSFAKIFKALGWKLGRRQAYICLGNLLSFCLGSHTMVLCLYFFFPFWNIMTVVNQKRIVGTFYDL